MSFNDLGITITAQNLASAEFARVASDAGAMAAQISGQTMEIYAEDFVSPEFNRIALEASQVKSEVEASPIIIPPVDTSQIQTSFNEVAVDAGVMASQISSQISPIQTSFNDVGVAASEMGANVEASSFSFDDMGVHAEASTVKLSMVARGISSVSGLGLGLTVLATDFGLVDSQTTKYMRTTMAVIMVISEVARLISYSTLLTTGQTAAIGINTATQTAGASASIASTVALNIRSAATWIAVTAENALNISQATFLALTGVGIAVIVAAAAAMWYFANSMNAATASVTSFNAASSAMPSSVSSGVSNASLIRSGVEALG